MNPRVVQFYFPISGTLFIPIDNNQFFKLKIMALHNTKYALVG
jgi:hypothetical protein